VSEAPVFAIVVGIGILRMHTISSTQKPRPQDVGVVPLYGIGTFDDTLAPSDHTVVPCLDPLFENFQLGDAMVQTTFRAARIVVS
jgi:hypothetical protein